MNKTITVKEGNLMLELIRQYVATYVSDYPQMKHSLEIVIKDVAEKMAKELVMMVNLPKEHLKTVEDVATFHTPKTWFQHFKASHFPLWLLKKFPVVYHEEKMKVILKVGAVYPQLPEVYPRNVGEIRFVYHKNSPVSVYPTGRVGEDDY